ncbi:hypothetical protein acsn021_29460 [Anaerocolumna cellulosilytica]|uniref:Uncharacterized protein n=1 Tax=Anaerocolumna cellulosilytica TaxID=433286 RepID=A0A6S6R5J6_9FIRM|nr:hypothetical protein [Anaerocolumna cellulosilytica]MBB5197164.1 hypothetical protein [Anaerocolumna cellulosilytica]BCJ95377.1 hypothetical protein acsn021_29460 [Anaerocolumna cellulosilytica]
MENNDYQTNQPQNINNGSQLETPLSLGEWVVTLLILAIPCVNIVMFFVWGFGQGNISRRNFCRAALIFIGISTVFTFIFGAAMVAAIAEYISSYGLY